MKQDRIFFLTTMSLLFLALGVLATIILPALESPEAPESATRYTAEELRGKRIYQREGCWYCHTQQVRPTEVGIGTVYARGDIGPESRAVDYALDKPVLWGTQRQGPDLAHVAGRPYGGLKAWHVAHLVNPQALNKGTLMPAFGHLPEEELRALAAYLVTLK